MSSEEDNRHCSMNYAGLAIKNGSDSMPHMFTPRDIRK